MRILSITTLALTLTVLSACTVPLSGEHSMEHGQGTANTRTLSVHDLSTNNTLSFRIEEEGRTFIDYGVSHTKEMHLIVVRNDLTNFAHLHPARTNDGVWNIPFQLKEPGRYWLFADFVDAKHTPFTLRFERSAGGTSEQHPLVRDAKTTTSIDGYVVAMTVKKETGNEVTFTYDIVDAQGNAVHPEDYLGAKGHSVLLSPSGDFVHAHPPEESSELRFTIGEPNDDFYRMFTQFQINGKILTVHFDWEHRK